MATKKAKKATNKPTEPNARVQEQSQLATPGSAWMLWGGVIASSLVVIAVFWFYPDSKSEIAKRAQTAPSQDSRPSELEDSPLKTAAATQTTTPTVTPTAFALPSKPRSIDTKTEQDRLLAKVEKLVVDYPHSADAMHIAAITYSELLQTDKAATFFKNSLALDNRSPQVLVDYARLLLQTGQQQAAVDLLEPAAISIGSAALSSRPCASRGFSK